MNDLNLHIHISNNNNNKARAAFIAFRRESFRCSVR